MRMSRCFTWFPIGGYRRTQYIPRFGGILQEVGILLGSIFGRYKMVTLLYYILVSLFQVEEFGQVFQY